MCIYYCINCFSALVPVWVQLCTASALHILPSLFTVTTVWSDILWRTLPLTEPEPELTCDSDCNSCNLQITHSHFPNSLLAFYPRPYLHYFIFTIGNNGTQLLDTSPRYTGVLRAQWSTVPAAPPIRLPIPNPKTHPNSNPVFNPNPNPKNKRK